MKMDRIKYYVQKYMLPSIIGRGMGVGLLLLCLGLTTTSCEDMLDKGNDYVIYADDRVIGNPADTVTNVLGILNKLQGIAVRNNLFGELRADLVKVNENATTDLKEIASLDITDDNKYNAPRDYYAVINNCNYYLAHVDSLAGNTNRNEKYFEAEIAQVHSIRAWTYLQMVLVYGRVPFVTEPVVTKLQSDATYPMYDLNQICDYFINDLQPYYGMYYPNYVTIASIDPRMCFFPTQVVVGDLYLWKAVLNHDVEAAKQAAKAYYDYIVWDPVDRDSYRRKAKLVTGVRRAYWSTETLSSSGAYRMPSGSLFSTYYPNQTWGRREVEPITSIPMDSAAADGFYNELRLLYNSQPLGGVSNTATSFVEEDASISPSDVIKELSRAQEYVDYNRENQIVKVTADKFTDDQITEGYLGDLRYQDNNFTTMLSSNSEMHTYQVNYKNSYQHILVYRASQVYLRLAEALNYAGYPRFAKQILTMGLSNIGIEYEVLPYYPTAADSAFISYFDFNDTDFRTYARGYSRILNPVTYEVTRVTPVLRSSLDDCNMWGIHSHGSGLAFLNENYAPALPVDSTGYPYALREAIGSMPSRSNYDYPTAPQSPREVAKPSTWDAYPNVVVTEDQYKELNASWYTTTSYKNYVNRDSVGRYNTYLTVTLPAYEDAMEVYTAKTDSVESVYQTDMTGWNERRANFQTAYDAWYEAAYTAPTFIAQEQEQMDQLILDEQALELAYEGNRFYDLMRRAYWHNDNSIIANAVSKRDSSVGAKLLDRNNWFLNWKGKIGM